jgi:hypothetical protein
MWPRSQNLQITVRVLHIAHLNNPAPPNALRFGRRTQRTQVLSLLFIENGLGHVCAARRQIANSSALLADYTAPLPEVSAPYRSFPPTEVAPQSHYAPPAAGAPRVGAVYAPVGAAIDRGGYLGRTQGNHADGGRGAEEHSRAGAGRSAVQGRNGRHPTSRGLRPPGSVATGGAIPARLCRGRPAAGRSRSSAPARPRPDACHRPSPASGPPSAGRTSSPSTSRRSAAQGGGGAITEIMAGIRQWRGAPPTQEAAADADMLRLRRLPAADRAGARRACRRVRRRLPALGFGRPTP